MNKETKSRWPIIVSVIAVCVSLGALIWNAYQESKIYEHSITIDALSHKPLLEPVEEVELESIGLKLTGKPRKLRGIFKDSVFVVVGETLVIDCDVNGTFKVCNTGNDVATLTYYTILDTISTDDILRKWLLGEKQIETRWDTISMDFKHIDITPGETLSLPVKKRFQFVSETGEAILHIFLLYENQFGALFDTYYWVRFRCDLSTVMEKDGEYFVPSKRKVLEAVKPMKSRASYKLYRPRERVKALSTITKNQDIN